VHYVDDEVKDEEGNEICVAEWVEKPGDKPISCSFSPTEEEGMRRNTLLTCQSVIVSLIYYFGEELFDSPKDMLYLTPIY
jgi:hypothetical protein